MWKVSTMLLKADKQILEDKSRFKRWVFNWVLVVNPQKKFMKSNERLKFESAQDIRGIGSRIRPVLYRRKNEALYTAKE